MKPIYHLGSKDQIFGLCPGSVSNFFPADDEVAEFYVDNWKWSGWAVESDDLC